MKAVDGADDGLTVEQRMRLRMLEMVGTDGSLEGINFWVFGLTALILEGKPLEPRQGTPGTA